MPSKHSPGPSPYIGWKWSKPQTPVKPRSSASRAAVHHLVERHPVLRDVEPELHAVASSQRRRGCGSAGRRPSRRTGSRGRAGRWPRPGPPSPRPSGADRRPAGWSSSWSSVRAPRIVEVTPGRSVTQASATSAIDTPRPSATRCTASITSQVRSVPRRSQASMPRPGSSPSRVAPLGRWSRRYLPVSQPPPSGLHGISPRPASMRGRHDLPLDLADQQAVLRLQADRRRPGRARRARSYRLGQLPAGEVGETVVADLAGPDEAVEGPQGLLERGQRIPRVRLIEVDGVRRRAGSARRPAPG